ncbi:MAG: sulfurtransferase TusA family protein [Candidatus Omnitrophota bacterium]|nr:sulfurtransferase TusA family protein [Candidatus Omnitrophota bacterium]
MNYNLFNLPEEVKKDAENYRRSLEEFLADKIPDARFKGVRVPWGVYSHRGGKAFMSRIRIPAGAVNTAQLKALAEAAKKYGDGRLHITTRQDIQIHNIKLEDTFKVIDYLQDYGLSPRGGGGNTLRNITACPFSGICKDEVFDVRANAIALTEYFLRQESSFMLPRKFKITFSGCVKDCSGILINDVGLLADIRGGKKGFKIFVGGGLGASSRIGKLLEEFIPESELGYCVTALKNVFYKNGDRKDRHHNRLRFLVEKMGLDEFKKLYLSEFKAVKDAEHIALKDIQAFSMQEINSEIPVKEDKQYRDFLRYNIRPQRQKGYSCILLRIPQGDIKAEELAALAGLEGDFKDIEFRALQSQDIAIAWVENSCLFDIFLKIKNILQDFLYPDTLLDVTVCKGATTCNLGLCNSPALSRKIEEMIKARFIGKEVFKRLDIKLNGCPNSCGQHPIGKISFVGAAKRVDNRPVPFYKVLLGGRREAEKTALAKEAGMIAAKNAPLFLEEFLNKVEEKFRESIDIYEFLEAEAVVIAKELLARHAYMPSYLEGRNFYVDWGREDDFSLSGLGTGECGAGVIDMIEADLADAKIAIEEAEKKSYDIEKIKKAFFSASRALLIVKGVDPYNPEDAVSEFKKKFVDAKIASDEYADIENVFKAINDKLNAEQKKEKFLYAGKFTAHINELYKSMDPSFSFPNCAGESKPSLKNNEAPKRIMDLKGTPCPINYIKAKLALEDLDTGDILEVILDEGEPIRNVPESLKNDGHQVLSVKQEGKFYRILIKKG